MHRSRVVPPLALVAVLAQALAGAQSMPDYEKAPIHYSTRATADAVAQLQRTAPFFGSERDVLLAVLEQLDVPVHSQVLVFSRTSLQRGRIRPSRPRAIYFSDTIYVGWVPGGLIEVAAVDPHVGPVFYSLDPRTAPEKRTFTRDADCLRCHGGAFVRDIPGLFVRSVVAAEDGEPLLRFGTEVVDDETPFARRWGGWYVTGYAGTEPHRGNAFGRDDGDPNVAPESADRPQELSAFFDVTAYPAATSDVVGLLILEHQMTVQNALTRASLDVQRMMAYQHSLQAAFGEPRTDEPAYDSVRSVLASATTNLVDRLLMRGAAPVPDGVIGHDEFRQAFARNAPRSAAGHSLKDLDLHGQLFAQRCSYLIYSEAFRALPPVLKGAVLDRLRDALEDDRPENRYAYLSGDERERIRTILLETHPDIAAHWAGATVQGPAAAQSASQ